jgi:hypothetical protein
MLPGQLDQHFADALPQLRDFPGHEIAVAGDADDQRYQVSMRTGQVRARSCMAHLETFLRRRWDSHEADVT